MRVEWRKMTLPTVGKKCREDMEDNGLGYLRRRQTCDGGATNDFETADFDLVEELECLEYKGLIQSHDGSTPGVPQQKSGLGHSCDEMGQWT